MVKENKVYTPEEESEIQEARTLSDAEAIKNGAKYGPSGLLFNEEQKAEAERVMQYEKDVDKTPSKDIVKLLGDLNNVRDFTFEYSTTKKRNKLSDGELKERILKSLSKIKDSESHYTAEGKKLAAEVKQGLERALKSWEDDNDLFKTMKELDATILNLYANNYQGPQV